MRKIYILLFALVGISDANGQGCLPQGIMFETQEQIDSFQINYPGCTEIEGDVTIIGYDITNLIGLGVLTSIGGDLNIGFMWIGNPALISLSGLENLTSIMGHLYILNNHALTSLSGLEGLTYIGDYFEIENNNTLTSFSGLENLDSISGNLTIELNAALCSLSGLESLTYISGDLWIRNNPFLSTCNVEGLCNYLLNPSGSINVYNNATGCDTPPEIATDCGFTMPCLPYGNYYFVNQAEIDSFQTNYPGCTEIKGYVNIGSYIGTDITNLEGLHVISSIGGDFDIFYNDGLTGLSGLESLTSISEDLQIEHNSGLTNLSGLESLTSIGGHLGIGINSSLTSLSGLENLTSIGGILGIGYNLALTSLTGMENLTSVGGDFNISENYALTSLSGLQNLDSVGGNLMIQWTDALTVLSGVEGLTSIGGQLLIGNNSALTSLSGLDNIDAGSISDLHIYDNNLLSTCDVKSICDYLAMPNANVQIENNAPGCDSPDEVQAACLITVEEINTGNRITITPNPSNDKITISSSAITEGTYLLIFNVSGEKVLEMPLTEPETQIDISALPEGMYAVKLQTEKATLTIKIIKLK